MAMIDKTASIGEAIARIQNGASIMLGGFGVPGTPFNLIEELVRQGQKDLTIIKNDANETDMGVDWLLATGQTRKLITSHIGLNPRAVEMMNAGEIEVEFVPQGILAERIRVAGAGIMGFVTDIGMGTDLAKGKTEVLVNGKAGLLEPALRADFSLIHASKSDTFGNLVFSATARNFSPLMAMASEYTIAETEILVPAGEIQPDEIHTPAPFVDQVVAMPSLPEVYGVVKR